VIYIKFKSFKPYYKWITFNITEGFSFNMNVNGVLNLIINGLPSILLILYHFFYLLVLVLNLIINGLPSILMGILTGIIIYNCFKPYYKWITFNIIKYWWD